MIKGLTEAWTRDHLEALIIMLSSIVLLAHGVRQLLSFIADWSKPSAHRSDMARFYPHQYKNPTRWRLHGLSGVLSLFLGVALGWLVVGRLRGLGL